MRAAGVWHKRREGEQIQGDRSLTCSFFFHLFLENNDVQNAPFLSFTCGQVSAMWICVD